MARQEMPRFRWRRRASPLVVFALVAALAAFVTVLLPGRSPRSAPDVALILLDGRTVSLTELRGRPVLVSFWATSCVPCVEETPEFVRLYHDLGPRGLELYAVAMPYDPPLQVQRFVQQYGVPYPVALDVTGAVSRAFGDVNVVPTAYLLSPDGEIVLKHAGKLDFTRVRKSVAPYLGTIRGPQSPPAS